MSIHSHFLVPYFLRSWVLLLRIKSVIKIKTNLLMTGTLKKKPCKYYFIDKHVLGKPVDPLNSKLVHLAGTIMVLLYNGLSAFQYCEVTFGSNNYSILDSLYVVMVTLSTVGYGGKRHFLSVLRYNIYIAIRYNTSN